MLDIEQFRRFIIRPALVSIGLCSEAAEELLLGTALQESRLTYLAQLGGGPALGVFQMEPDTHNDIYANFLAYKPELRNAVLHLTGNDRRVSNLVGNMPYAAAMCRVHYYRRPEPLPAAGDIEGHAAYWKAHYNTPAGAGTESEYIHNWNTHTENAR